MILSKVQQLWELLQGENGKKVVKWSALLVASVVGILARQSINWHMIRDNFLNK